MTKAVAHLPADAARHLQELKAEEQEGRFHAYLLELREAGWPLRAIAEPLNVSRAAVMSWQRKAEAEHLTRNITGRNPLVPVLPLSAHAQPYYAKKITPDIPKKDLPELLQLHRQAKKVTRWTSEDNEYRQAARQLEERILFYANQRKGPVASIAKHLGVTRRAIAQRIEKHDR
mgnify:CR=1 FL=1